MRVRLSSAIVLCAALASSVFFCGCDKNVGMQIFPHDCESGCNGQVPCPAGFECVHVDASQTTQCCKISQTPPTAASAFTSEGSMTVPFKKDVQVGETVQLFNMPILQREMVYTDQKVNLFASITDLNGNVPKSLSTSLNFAVGVVRIGCPTEMTTPLSFNAKVGPQGQLGPMTGFAPLVLNCSGGPQPARGDPAILELGDRWSLSVTNQAGGTIPEGSLLHLTAVAAASQCSGAPPASLNGSFCKLNTDCLSGTCGSNGTCVECAAGNTFCAAAGACFNLENDPSNCGSCATACGSAQTCSGGVCISTCPTPNMVCGTACVNLQTDPNNCATCGNACNTTNGTAFCSGGACGITCSAGFGDCDNNASNGCETNLSNSVNNCGTCGNKCTAPANATPVCSGAVCGFACNTGYTACTAGCVNLLTDVNNCGSCGHACGPTQTACSGGTCI